MRLLKHALPVVAHFDWALALTLSVPRDRLTHLVAPGLFLDTFEGQGFLAVACVQTRRLRPAGVPAVAGIDFFLAGYRLFVTRERGGRTRRGLQILGSETDRWLMAAAGRVFTHYGYRRTIVDVSGEGGRRRIATSSGLVLEADCGRAELPSGSVFTNWESARRYAGPMPFTSRPTGMRSSRWRAPGRTGSRGRSRSSMSACPSSTSWSAHPRSRPLRSSSRTSIIAGRVASVSRSAGDMVRLTAPVGLMTGRRRPLRPWPVLDYEVYLPARRAGP